MQVRVLSGPHTRALSWTDPVLVGQDKGSTGLQRYCSTSFHRGNTMKWQDWERMEWLHYCEQNRLMSAEEWKELWTLEEEWRECGRVIEDEEVP